MLLLHLTLRGRDSSPEPDAIKTRHQIVDFVPDDEDSEWEDMDGEKLEGISTTTHHSRHRTKPVIPIWKHCRCDSGANSRVSACKRKEAKGDKYGVLARDIKVWEVECEGAGRKACHQGAGSPPSHARLIYLQAYSQTEPLQHENLAYNGHEMGEHYKMAEIKHMVADDPTMIDDFTEEEEEEMIREIEEKQVVKHHGARMTNKAAKDNARLTMEHLAREILKKEPTDIQSMFELWAVNQLWGTGLTSQWFRGHRELDAPADAERMHAEEGIWHCQLAKGDTLQADVVAVVHQAPLSTPQGLDGWDLPLEAADSKGEGVHCGAVQRYGGERGGGGEGGGAKKTLRVVEDEEEEEEGLQKAVADMSVEERRKKLQWLARMRASRDEDEEVEVCAPPKRKAAAHNDDDEKAAQKRRKSATKRDSGERKERAPRKSVKCKATTDGDKDRDKSAPRKKAKRKATADGDEDEDESTPRRNTNTTNPSMQPPQRPLPTPIWKGTPGASTSSKSAAAEAPSASPPTSPPRAVPSLPESPHATTTMPASPPRASPTCSRSPSHPAVTPAATSSVVPDSEPPSSCGGTAAVAGAWGAGAMMPLPSGWGRRGGAGQRDEW
ncbi:hypothetical protein C8R43DRAFT_961099 [Mycena crocata]|nr:hypothetical protein C8R43DRAFT_961099 [Mycena crocata]